MIVHIALFQWKKGTSPEKIRRLLVCIKNLKHSCKGILDIFVGENYHKESKGLTHGVVVIAQDQQALDNYRRHSDHEIVAQEINSIEEDSIGFDFEDITQ